jgi:adenylate cyclase
LLIEYLVPGDEKPLQLQLRWLWEVGYDPENDQIQDILREDNSYLYRWVFSDSSPCSNLCSSNFQLNDITLPITANEQRIAEIIKSACDDRNDLFAVDLSGMNLDSIPPVLFKTAKKIAMLDLSRNHGIDLKVDFIQLCQNLKMLSLSQAGLRKVPKAVASIVGLEVLDLSNNSITSLRDSNLNELHNLRRLNLSNNRLIGKNAIPSEITSQWKYLEYFNLSCNWLKGELLRSVLEVGYTTAESVSTLMELDLSYNLITSLPNDFAERLPNLKKLYLVSNQLSCLPEGVLRQLDLECLDIRGNHLRGIVELSQEFVNDTDAEQENIFCPSKLLLDNNHISNITINRNWSNLQSIVSHRNTGLLQVTVSSVLPQLSTLVLSYSRLAFLPDDFFQHTPNLKVLILNHNQITSLPHSISQLKSLVRFEICNNSLSTLPASIKDLKSLEIWDLHENNLKDIPAAIWDMRLKSLNLSSNVIEAWPEFSIVSPNSADGNSRKRSQRPTSIIGDMPFDFTQAALHLSHSSTQNSLSISAAISLCNSLTWFSIADNRLESSFFENPIQYMQALKSLNVSHNDIFNVAPGSLRNSSATLEELYLSGNHLTQLPDDLFFLKKLKRLYVNGNRLGSLPPELGKIPDLRILDVGKNQLRYNVGNWPYDWNWNWNLELRCLNFSGNPRLEIRPNLARTDLNSSQPNSVLPGLI